MDYYQFRAMNSDVLLAGEGSAQRVSAGFDQVKAFIESSERRFTRFSDDSELAALNRSAGGWFQASSELFEVLWQARFYHLQTGGLFNPAILPALKSAGYDRSMDEIRTHGATPSVPNTVNQPAPDFRAVRFKQASRQVCLPTGMQIDLGGIAKGWIAERAAHILASYAQTCAVNAGGDMFLIGLPEGETAWQVALDDPQQPGANLAVLNVDQGAVATSSVTKRRWQQGSRTQHHLIDPRSGQPAETDWLSVSVIAPHASTAEVYAKALLIAGDGGAKTLVPADDSLAYIAVDHAGRLWGSHNSWEHLYVKPELVS
jgi:thiamine biosynthesis lipoprotein